MNTLPPRPSERSAPDLLSNLIDELRRQHDQHLLLSEDRATSRAHQSDLKQAVKASWANTDQGTAEVGVRIRPIGLITSVQEISDQEFDKQACDILAMRDHRKHAF